jgi:photosystem II stability/assembly factor-like uncharacterized protein
MATKQGHERWSPRLSSRREGARPVRSFACIVSLAAIITLAWGIPAPAATDLPASSLTWVRTGGPLGGMGYDIRMRTEDPDVMLVTDANAGVHMSTDGGATWQPSNTGITIRTGTSGDAVPVFCLTIDPHDDDIVWAGTQNLRGIFRSGDGGATWNRMNSGVVEPDGITFRGFTVDPRTSDTVYAAAEISSWQWNGGVGKPGREFDLVKGVVYKTIDGGKNWKAVWRGDNLARYIWIDPQHPDTLYVSTGIFDREAANSDPADSAKAHPGGEGIVKSTDGGLTWTHANQGLDNLYVGSLFMNPQNPQVLLAGAGNNQYSDKPGAYLSTDGGASWRRTLDCGDTVTSVEFAVSDPRIAYAASPTRFFRSDDGGLSWTGVTAAEGSWGPPGVVAGFPIDLQVDPRNPNRVFVNSYLGGNFLSEDGGATWAVASKGYTGAQSRDIAVDPVEPGRVLTAGRSGLFKSMNGGVDWVGLQSPPNRFNEFNAVAIDPKDGRHILGASNWTKAVAESHDGGRSWAMRDSHLVGETPFAYRTLAFAPSNPELVYAGTGSWISAGTFSDALPGKGVYLSRDGGTTWTAANDANSNSAQVANIAVHPMDPQTAYLAALGSGLLRTTNAGSSWTRVAGPWPSTAMVRAVAFSPADPRRVFVGTNAGMYVTPDGGASWQQLPVGLLPESDLTSVVVDPTDPQILYVSDLLSGVYRSTNGGALWTPINQGLRTRAVNRLALSSDGQHLYAATEGEGVFRLDLNGTPPPTAAEPVEQVAFSDVPSTHPYYAQIVAVAGAGIVGGYADGTFGPDRSVTRQQFAKMIVKALKLPVTGSEVCPFIDVAKGLDAKDPFYPDKYVAVCAANGITTGASPTTFNPTGTMTRAQLITMVARAAQLPDPLVDYAPPFPEFSPVHYPWARRAAYAGLLDGLAGMGPDFDFLKPATRGEVCVLLQGLLE